MVQEEICRFQWLQQGTIMPLEQIFYGTARMCHSLLIQGKSWTRRRNRLVATSTHTARRVAGYSAKLLTSQFTHTE